jgi:hypothetical protein
VYPTHYTGEKGYISDTEGANIINVTTPTVPRPCSGVVSESCGPKDEL